MGWYTTAYALNVPSLPAADRWDFGSNTVNSDISLYAAWNGVGYHHHTVTFNANGGKIEGKLTTSRAIDNPYTTISDAGIAMPPDPTMSGQVFRGWSKSGSGSSTVDFFPDTTVTGDITVYAVWKSATSPTNREKLILSNGVYTTKHAITDPDEPLSYAIGFTLPSANDNKGYSGLIIRDIMSGTLELAGSPSSSIRVVSGTALDIVNGTADDSINALGDTETAQDGSNTIVSFVFDDGINWEDYAGATIYMLVEAKVKAGVTSGAIVNTGRLHLNPTDDTFPTSPGIVVVSFARIFVCVA
jgi:uncharacterized repeat protein (TIGR02543 family)